MTVTPLLYKFTILVFLITSHLLRSGYNTARRTSIIIERRVRFFVCLFFFLNDANQFKPRQNLLILSVFASVERKG